MSGHAAQLAALQRQALAHPRDARVQLALGQTLQHLQRPLDALTAYERASQLDPALGPVWTARGHLLRQAGRLADASVCFQRALACGEDADQQRFFLGALGLGALPATAPLSFVRDLFDEYAGGFDAELVDALHYRGHVAVAAPLAALRPGGFDSALDIGCGSGLAAPLLRPLARRLAGVDLAPKMVDAARATGLYDALHVDDLVAHLDTTDARHDLVVACDVLIYMGRLEPAFAAVARVLRPGGVFGLSVEAGEAEDGVDLLPTLRYTHSEAYLRRLAQAHGLRVARSERGPLRESHGEQVAGLFMHLVRD